MTRRYKITISRQICIIAESIDQAKEKAVNTGYLAFNEYIDRVDYYD